MGELSLSLSQNTPNPYPFFSSSASAFQTSLPLLTQIPPQTASSFLGFRRHCRLGQHRPTIALLLSLSLIEQNRHKLSLSFFTKSRYENPPPLFLFPPSVNNGTHGRAAAPPPWVVHLPRQTASGVTAVRADPLPAPSDHFHPTTESASRLKRKKQWEGWKMDNLIADEGLGIGLT